MKNTEEIHTMTLLDQQINPMLENINRLAYLILWVFDKLSLITTQHITHSVINNSCEI
jgi:hypothetical protein